MNDKITAELLEALKDLLNVVVGQGNEYRHSPYEYEIAAAKEAITAAQGLVLRLDYEGLLEILGERTSANICGVHLLVDTDTPPHVLRCTHLTNYDQVVLQEGETMECSTYGLAVI